jgi:hypothetical protein
MAIRTARSGAVRWARAALIALWAAHAVLIDHETAPASATTATQSATRGGMPMPGISMSAGAAADRMDTRAGDPAAYSADDGACAATGMQHCSTASVDTITLTLPPQVHIERLPNAYQAIAGPALARTIGRARPDLSDLSQLRLWAAPNGARVPSSCRPEPCRLWRYHASTRGLIP